MEEYNEERGSGDYEESATISPGAMHPDLGKYILESRGDWTELALLLHGYEMDAGKPFKDDGTINWVRGEPLMNSLGIKLIINALIGGISNKGVYLSNLNENETYSLARKVLNSISKMLFAYNKDFGIKSMAEQTTIMELIRVHVMAVLKRPYMEGERKFFRKIESEKRIVSENQRKGAGIFGRGK